MTKTWPERLSGSVGPALRRKRLHANVGSSWKIPRVYHQEPLVHKYTSRAQRIFVANNATFIMQKEVVKYVRLPLAGSEWKEAASTCKMCSSLVKCQPGNTPIFLQWVGTTKACRYVCLVFALSCTLHPYYITRKISLSLNRTVGTWQEFFTLILFVQIFFFT
jgi:hypothetical protein